MVTVGQVGTGPTYYASPVRHKQLDAGNGSLANRCPHVPLNRWHSSDQSFVSSRSKTRAYTRRSRWSGAVGGARDCGRRSHGVLLAHCTQRRGYGALKPGQASFRSNDPRHSARRVPRMINLKISTDLATSQICSFLDPEPGRNSVFVRARLAAVKPRSQDSSDPNSILSCGRASTYNRKSTAISLNRQIRVCRRNGE